MYHQPDGKVTHLLKDYIQEGPVRGELDEPFDNNTCELQSIVGVRSEISRTPPCSFNSVRNQ